MKKHVLYSIVLLQSGVCALSSYASEDTLSLSLPSGVVSNSSTLPRAEQKEEEVSKGFPIKTLTVLLPPSFTDKAEQENSKGYSPYAYQSLKKLKKTLNGLPCSVDYVTDIEEFLKSLQSGRQVEFVLNLQYAPEDFTLPHSSITELMERYGVKYSHSAGKKPAACEDKVALYQVASSLQVLSPPQITLTSKEILSNDPVAQAELFPAFLKPQKGQGNFGICEQSHVDSLEDLRDKFPLIQEAFPSIDEWVLQKYLSGDEYTVVILGNESEREILPVAKLKWDEGAPPFKVFDRQNLGGLNPENPNYRLFITPEAITEKITNSAKILSDALDLQDCFQCDFRCDEAGNLFLIDVNTTPWWGVNSVLCSLAKGLGYSYDQLIKKMLKTSLKRHFATADLRALDSQVVIRKPFPIAKLSVLLLHGFASSPYESDRPTIGKLRSVLSQLPCSVEYLDDHTNLLSRLDKDHPEFVLDLTGDHLCLGLHTFVPMLFDVLNIRSSKVPVHRGLTARNQTVSKGIMNYLARKNGIPCPEEIPVTTKQILQKCFLLPQKFPVFLKPSETCASQGVCKHNRINSAEEFDQKFAKIHEKFPTIENWVLQEYLPGSEYTIGVLGHGEKREILPVVQLSFVEKETPAFFTREAKDDQNGMSHMPNGLYCDNVVYSVGTTPPTIEIQIQESVKKTCDLFDCVDYVRMDFRCNAEGVPMLLDINCSPWWGVDAALYLSAQAVGYSFEAMILKMLNSALERYYPSLYSE